MGCFSPDWFLHLLFVLVVICAAIAILKIWVFPLLASADGRIVATINVLIWLACALFALYLVGYLIVCAWNGGFMFPGRVR